MFIVSWEICFIFDELVKNMEILIGIWLLKGVDEMGEGK